MLDGTVDPKAAQAVLERAPRRFAAAVTGGAVEGIGRYRGYHRRLRMARKSTTERVGVWASSSGAGIKSNRWQRVQRLSSEDLGKAGAEIVIRNVVMAQLEHGAEITGRFTIPFSKFQTKGSPTARARNALKSGKLIVVGRGGRQFLALPGTGRRGRRGLTLMYTLRRRIVIPARLDYGGLFHRTYGPEIMKRVSYRLEREIARLNSGK